MRIHMPLNVPILVLYTLAGTACDETICEPGETQNCVCATGQSGSQSCAAQANGWLACECQGQQDAGIDAGQQDAFVADTMPMDGHSDDVIQANCQDTGCQSPLVCDTDVTSSTAGQCIGRCGSDVACASGRYCDDARFTDTGLCLALPTSCSNEVCLQQDQLCDIAPTSPTLHLCIDPDAATNSCDAPGAHTSSGPILYLDDPNLDVEVITDAADDPGNGSCIENGNLLVQYFFSVSGELSSQPFSDTYMRSATASSWANSYYTDAFSDVGYSFLAVYACFISSGTHTVAVYHEGPGGQSNRICVSVDVP